MKCNKKAVRSLIDHFGSQRKTADAFGVLQQTVSLWAKKGIPPKRAMEAAKMTKGKFTVDQFYS